MVFVKRLTKLAGLLLLGLYCNVWADEIFFHLKFNAQQNNADILKQEEQLFTQMHMKHAGHMSQQILGNTEITFEETLRNSFLKTRTSFENGTMHLVIAQDKANNLLGSIFFCLAEMNGENVIRIRHFNARNFNDHANLRLLFKGMLPHIQTVLPCIKSVICVSNKAVKVYDEGLKAIGFQCINFIPEGCNAEHQQTYEYKIDDTL